MRIRTLVNNSTERAEWLVGRWLPGWRDFAITVCVDDEGGHGIGGLGAYPPDRSF